MLVPQKTFKLRCPKIWAYWTYVSLTKNDLIVHARFYLSIFFFGPFEVSRQFYGKLKKMQSVTFFPRYTNGFILPPSFDGWDW